MLKFDLSSNLTIFDLTQTRDSHSAGKFVKYDNKTLAIGGWSSSRVEELNRTTLSWADHPMSPVEGSSSLDGFTALTVDKSLFIFAQRSVIEWNGTSWKTLENGLCRNRFGHTTVVYAGEIYHIGGQNISENGYHRLGVHR